jgi:hypothetical protein
MCNRYGSKSFFERDLSSGSELNHCPNLGGYPRKISYKSAIFSGGNLEASFVYAYSVFCEPIQLNRYGGLTIIANAPNPVGLLLGALAPTFVAILAFNFL